MNFEDMNSIIQELSSSGEIKITDIPDIDLYMDQVTTFIENKLGNEKRDKKDKLLTPSKNKKYNKQQMIQLILIYYLKQILSINDIQDLFKSLFQADNSDDSLVNDVYNVFLQIKRTSIGNIDDMLDDMPDLLSQTTGDKQGKEKDDVQMLVTVLMLVSQAQACKRAAEAIIDKHFKAST